MRRAAGGIATAVLTAAVGIAACLGNGASPAAAQATTPLPRALPPVPVPLHAEWTKRSANLTALRVDLDATGAHTHDNWIFFRLPFDSTDRERIREVRVEPSAMIDPDVSAIRVDGACAPYKSYGPIGTWAGYTTGAVGPTLAFAGHPTPPTNDPMIFGLNVPSRVANYVACGWQKSATLRDPATWHLEVSWEER